MSIVYLDLETASVDELWSYGPGFVRLAGYAIGVQPVVTTTDIDAVVEMISQSGNIVVGHNVLAFDLPALALYHGLDLDRIVDEGRVIDTLLVARQNDPAFSGGVDDRRYGLDALGRRVLGEGKVASDGRSVLKKLAKHHGGFDKIPVDDPDYIKYLVQDVELVRELAKHLVVDDYAIREHRVLHRLNQISRFGIRVDVARAEQVIAAQADRVASYKLRLHEEYGLPLQGAAPQRSKAGVAALEKAFEDLGVAPPRTLKGSLATSSDTLEALVAEHPGNEALTELCGVLAALNGARSVPQTVLDHVSPDGRVHPEIDARQATGRISVKKPGVTVIGKRDRRNILERALLLPDEGDVLLPVDLSAIDGRAVAICCEDPAYRALFGPGEDLHDGTALAVFGRCGWDGVGHHPRRGDAKALSHATNYGMGAAGFAASSGVPLVDAVQQLAALAAGFPKLTAWKAATREAAKGQVLVTAFGRRVRVHPASAYTQATAALGQGTARDLMMDGVLRLPAWLVPRLRAVVHDELVFSIPEDRVDEARKQILAALQFVVNGVPILAEAGDPGRDWADCYRTELSAWPEVARSHREMLACDDTRCTWHGDGAPAD